MSGSSRSLLTAEEWDKAVLAEGGHFLQSWRWGAFKARFGWQVERVSVADRDNIALAQILVQSRGPVSVGYVPRGPVVPAGESRLAQDLMSKVDSRLRHRRALYALIEPDQPLPLSGTYKHHGFVAGTDHIQPARTVKVPLLPDEQLLAQMKQNTRYSVRLAVRKGVEIVRCGQGYDLTDFYQLLRETADRNAFSIHSEQYYRDFVDTFGQDSLCLFARTSNNLAAALIAAKHGTEAIYMYGASSSQYRSSGAAFLLQFEAMKWARDVGCNRYDLWGIPALDPVDVSTESGDFIASTKGNDRRGLYRFKIGFGGEIVSYPPMLERRYSPVGSFLARRLTRRADGDT